MRSNLLSKLSFVETLSDQFSFLRLLTITYLNITDTLPPLVLKEPQRHEVASHTATLADSVKVSTPKYLTTTAHSIIHQYGHLQILPAGKLQVWQYDFLGQYLSRYQPC